MWRLISSAPIWCCSFCCLGISSITRLWCYQSVMHSMRNLYLAIYNNDKLSATSSMQLSPWYLSIIAMVPSIRSPFSGVQWLLSFPQLKSSCRRQVSRPIGCLQSWYCFTSAWCSACCSVHFADLQRFFSSSICYKLQYSVVATTCRKSPTKLELLLSKQP